MKIQLEGVVSDQHAIGTTHLIRVGIKVKGTNENLTLGPTCPEVMLWLTCTPEQARELYADRGVEGALILK